jgi:hypothetical protein
MNKVRKNLLLDTVPRLNNKSPKYNYLESASYQNKEAKLANNNAKDRIEALIHWSMLTLVE